MTRAISGRCLCGAVTVAVEGFDGSIGACHCGMCRRWSGGPSLTLRSSRIQHTGSEHIRTHRSSEWAERSFCAVCGTHLFYTLRPTGEFFVWAGLFDTLPDATLDHQVFIDRKPDWYAFAGTTANLTEAEVFAKYAPSGG